MQFHEDNGRSRSHFRPLPYAYTVKYNKEQQNLSEPQSKLTGWHSAYALLALSSCLFWKIGFGMPNFKFVHYNLGHSMYLFHLGELQVTDFAQILEGHLSTEKK